MSKLLLLIGTFLITFSANSAVVPLGNFGCENNSDRFDNNLQINFGFFYSGSASCLANANTYFWILENPQSVVASTFSLVLHIEGSNQNLNIRGRLDDGSLVTFSRVSSVRVNGADGERWRRQTYEYDGTGDFGNLEQIEFVINNTRFLDDFSLSVDSPFAGLSYFNMKAGQSDVFVPITLDDILNEQQLASDFYLEGRLVSGEIGVVYAVDPGINPFVYLECVSGLIVNTTIAPTDQLGASYQFNCLDSDLVSDKRGLFSITNTGTTPINAVEFHIQMNSLARLLEDATSTNFNFQLLLSTGVE